MSLVSPPLGRTRARSLLCALSLLSAGAASAQPTSVTLVGTEAPLCAPGDTACTSSRLDANAADGIWRKPFSLGAKTYSFRTAVDEAGTLSTYGQKGVKDGAPYELALTQPETVKFYYDPASHWTTSNKAPAIIGTVAGSFQSELGCPGDWAPDCLRSWLTDVDGDGIYTFTTTALPEGRYECKVAYNENWNESYGENGGSGNMGFTVRYAGKPVTFSFDPKTHLTTIDVFGAPKGDILQSRAQWVSGELLVWSATGVAPVPAGSVFRLHHDASGGISLGDTGLSGGSAITLSVEGAGLPAAIAERYPHLKNRTVLRVPSAEVAKVKDILKGQMVVSLTDADNNLANATGVQIPLALDALYANDEALGVSWSGSTPTFKLWAPTARNVNLFLYSDSKSTTTGVRVAMTADANTGVWSAKVDGSWRNKFYLYEVEVYVPSQKKVLKTLVTDPYSLSLSLNSKRSQIVNLADPELAPAGWSTLQKPALDAPEDIVLYELHVRDFSINDRTVPEARRGTFSAFSETGSNGMKHLKGLAEKGLTHVHLLPVFDIATIEEDRAKQKMPVGNLVALPPDSTEQQAAVTAVKDLDGFNWGYDPFHYTVPEGSYAVNPDGNARIVEFRQMVKSLSDTGLRVVMDVVYNHVNGSGQSDTSVLDKVVPGYYQRLDDSGSVTTSTCCQNTASEHLMFEKLMVDSLVTWAKYYKVDGFRFDLMGHHMKSNMLKVQERLRALTLEKDGVDGSKIYLYGEGWNFGEVENNARGINATQLNMPGTGIGTFSDRLRDAARGGGPFSGLQEQGFISGLWTEPNSVTSGTADQQRQRLLLHMDQIRVGLAGNLRDFSFVDRMGNTVKGSQVDYNGQPAGYTLDPQEVITYVSAHDNETLFDAVQMKAPGAAGMDVRVRMHNMGLSLVALAQGVPFIHAGDELLRSKSLDRDSYNSGDWFNAIDFTYASNNWGVGLPPEEKNKDNWPVMKTLLGNPALKATPEHIRLAHAHLGDMLSIRKSAALFRLRTAEAVQKHLSFLNTGASQVPGLIVMKLEDSAATDGTTDAVVFFNASEKQQVFRIDAYANRDMRLHPVQQDSQDMVVRGASFQPSGDFTVPAHSTVVFVNARTVTTMPGEGGCGGCAGTGGGAFGALAVMLVGLLRRRRLEA